jgi:hypothetical protein
VKLALHAGFPPAEFYIHEWNRFGEIEEAQSLGVIINIDSLNLEKFERNLVVVTRSGSDCEEYHGGGNIKISTGTTKANSAFPLTRSNKYWKSYDTI